MNNACYFLEQIQELKVEYRQYEAPEHTDILEYLEDVNVCLCGVAEGSTVPVTSFLEDALADLLAGVIWSRSRDGRAPVREWYDRAERLCREIAEDYLTL